MPSNSIGILTFCRYWLEMELRVETCETLTLGQQSFKYLGNQSLLLGRN